MTVRLRQNLPRATCPTQDFQCQKYAQKEVCLFALVHLAIRQRICEQRLLSLSTALYQTILHLSFCQRDVRVRATRFDTIVLRERNLDLPKLNDDALLL